MNTLASLSDITKTVGSRTLFEGLSFGIYERQKLALMGRNGVGKSTLLKIISGQEPADEGKVTLQKGLQLFFVPQSDSFTKTDTVYEAAYKIFLDSNFSKEEADLYTQICLSKIELTDYDKKISELSGGWRKKLLLSVAFTADAQLYLLDEPTNHLDWENIYWLESSINQLNASCLVVSHDRRFLNQTCKEYMEIGRSYQNGFFTVDGDYNKFLEKRESLLSGQIQTQKSMANKARRETDWLRAGVKARTTKSSSRIKEAEELIDNLGDMRERNLHQTKRISVRIQHTGTQAKKLIEVNDLCISMQEKPLTQDFSMVFPPKTRMGILGPNGVGKTTLLRTLIGEHKDYTGRIKNYDTLKMTYFEQNKTLINEFKNMFEFMGDGSDHVIVGESSVHVASYLSKFHFSKERFFLPIAQLSGGEKARLMIAKLLAQPVDVLILDEPTNDLDIETLEVLETAVAQFEGLIFIVSHDREFLENSCNRFLGLEKDGRWQVFPSLSQWETHFKNSSEQEDEFVDAKPQSSEGKKSKVKLSYKEKRFLENFEADIEKAEADLEKQQALLQDPEYMNSREKMTELFKTIEFQQKSIENLYAEWERIEAKN